jgi:6-phosphogluconate dehydrogenase
MAKLRHPRTILIFGSEEAPVNLVLDQLLTELKLGDLVMDAGDSHFKDTAQYKSQLAERGVQFVGIGLAGGEKGARHGGIVMAGGAREALARTRPLLEAMATKVRGEPCVSYFESAAAARFVKMCHAAIEHALLQLLAETFDLLQRILFLNHEELRDAAGVWRLGALHSYLTEISAQGFEPADQQEPRLVLEERLELARNEPLGKWAAQSAWELEAPVPTIEAAVGAPRVAASQRQQAWLAAAFRQAAGRFGDDTQSVLEELHGALYAAMMITYAQGISLLSAASQHLGFRLNLHEITRAWRGCTHMRTSLLDDIAAALQATPDLPGLLCDDDLSQAVMDRQENLPHAVWRAHQLDLAVPALLASLDYLDAHREAWLPVNLIQVPHGESDTAETLPMEWAF